MNYRKDKYGNELSVLGYGCMRFPRKHGKIDMDIAEKLLCEAVEQGINYYDTAYIYTGSESAIGEIFEKNGIRKDIPGCCWRKIAAGFARAARLRFVKAER